MELEDIEKVISTLKWKLYRTKSRKLKNLIIADIMTLNKYANTHIEKCELGLSQLNIDYQKYLDKLYDEKKQRVFEAIDGIKENEEMGINLLRPYEEANFLPFQGDDLTLRNPERGYEFLRDFMGYMGPLAYKKYNELVDNDAILLSSLYNTGGVCWDFPVLNKQIIVIDENSGIYNLMAAAHEVGHAVHFNKLNQIGKRKIENNTFVESMSTLFEEEFIKFGLENGVDFTNLRNYVYSQKLTEALSVIMASRLIFDGRKIFNGEDVVFDPFELEEIGMENEHYSYFADSLASGLEYVNPLLYLTGFAATRKILTSCSGKDALNEMLDFLIRTELHTHKENVEYLDLNNFDYPNLKEELIDNSNKFVLK